MQKPKMIKKNAYCINNKWLNVHVLMNKHDEKKKYSLLIYLCISTKYIT